VLLAGFAALAAWASWNFVYPPARVTVIPILATRAEVRREGTPLFKAAGWIEPRPTAVRVAALAPGVVERLLVVEDQAVRAGEPIAELVKDDAQLAFRQAVADEKLREAELAEARATLAAAVTRLEQPVHLQAQLSEVELALAQIETQLKNLPYETQRAEARLALAQQSFRGKTEAQGAVSGLALVEAKSELESATSLVAELKERLGSLSKEKDAILARRDAYRTQLSLLADEIRARDESQAKVDAASSRLESARVAVAQAKLRLERMTVRAPIDGRVFRLVGQPGTTLTGNSGASALYDGSTVVTLYRPDQLQARVDVRFDDIPNVHLGQPVEIENPALKEPLAGKVLFVSSLANIQKNTLDVKVAIESPPEVFKPEMLVNATFLAPAGSDRPAGSEDELRLYLPHQHVHQDDVGAFAWVADRSAGVARRVPIRTTNAGNDGLVEVQEGLNISSRVISSGYENLRDGGRIFITGEEPDDAPSASAPSNAKRRTLDRLPPGELH
jgi:RND family efflux transporter MFP subunit